MDKWMDDMCGCLRKFGRLIFRCDGCIMKEIQLSSPVTKDDVQGGDKQPSELE